MIFFFVRQSLLNLFETYIKDKHYQHINIWSDNGSHHFKTRYTQYFLHTLSNQYHIGITHNFCAPNHGHDLADNFAGTIKRMVRQNFKDAQRMKLVHYYDTDGPTNAHEVATLINDKVKNSDVIPFATVRDRNNATL